MNWLPISTSTRTSPEFIGSEPIQRATWLCLMLYCAEHETGGVIRDCASWGDRRWMQTIGSTKAEVLADCALFRFVGDDMVVWGYDPDYERIVRDKRIIGKRGGMASAASRKRNKLDECLNHTLNHTVQRIGEEGMGMDRRVENAHAGEIVTLSGMKASPPTMDEVLIHAGIVGMSEQNAREFFDYWTGAEWTRMNGVPLRNWKAAMVSRKNDLANGGKNHGRTNNRRRVADNHWSSGSGEYNGKF